MINRRAILTPLLAAALFAAGVTHAAAQPTPGELQAEIAAAAQEAAVAIREVTREVTATARREARTVTRYQGRNNRFEQTDHQTRTLKVGANGLIELRNIAGDITVTAGSGDTATIEIDKVARGASDADAREQLGIVTVDVVERAGRVEVSAKYPENRARNGRRNFNVSTAYRVTAPAGTRIKTDSISGSVTVTGLRGDLTLNTISGDIRIERAGKVVNGQSISGAVELISAEDDAVVELSSTSGNVLARGVKVRRLDLGSISGTVRGSDLQCDAATLHTISGNVEYGGSLTNGGSYDFQTHSGDVRLTVSGGTGFEIKASTFSGEIRSGLQLKLESTGGRDSRTIRGTYGDGRARVEASSFSGTIIINGK